MEPVEMIGRFYRLMNAGNHQQAAELFSDRIVYKNRSALSTLGKQKLIEVLQSQTKAGFVYAVKSVSCEPNIVKVVADLSCEKKSEEINDVFVFDGDLIKLRVSY